LTEFCLDRRAIRVCLTRSGQATADQLQHMIADANQGFLAKLTPEEGLILRALLKKLV